MTKDDLRGFSRFADMAQAIRVGALALVSPTWRRAVADAAAMQDFRARMREVGIPLLRSERVVMQELGRTGPIGMGDRLKSAEKRLLSGAPYDGTNTRFERMLELWCTNTYPNRDDARAALLSLYDRHIFGSETERSMRESDINDDRK